MGGWVLGEEASVHDPGSELLEAVSRWTPALGDGGCRFFGDIRGLAAAG